METQQSVEIKHRTHKGDKYARVSNSHAAQLGWEEKQLTKLAENRSTRLAKQVADGWVTIIDTAQEN